MIENSGGGRVGLSGRFALAVGFLVITAGMQDDESDPAGNLVNAVAEILDERLVIFDDDQLRPRANCHFQQSRVFQIDCDQIGDAAQNRIPRRIVRRLGAAQDFFDADPQTLLPVFQIFQHAFPRLPAAAPFTLLGQRSLELGMFAQQRFPKILQPAQFLFGAGRLLGSFIDAPLSLSTFFSALGNQPVKVVAAALGIPADFFSSGLLRFERGYLLFLGRHLLAPIEQLLFRLLDCLAIFLGLIGQLTNRIFSRRELLLQLVKIVFELQENLFVVFAFGAAFLGADRQSTFLFPQPTNLRVKLALPRCLVMDGRLVSGNCLSV